MTTQELKDNRSEILSRINEIADTTKTSEIMTAMLRIVEGGMNETNDAVELVDEVVTLFGYEKKVKVIDQNADHISKLGSKWNR